MYEIIDNFLPENEFNSIKNTIISTTFPWFYNFGVATKEDKDNFYFTHIFFQNCTINSNYYNIINFILSPLNVKALIRVKGNLYPRTQKLISHLPHKDYPFEHKSAIFYVNTNNGFTVLEDGTKIESVENRILLFDGSKMHNSTTCTDEKIRVNINFNYF